MSGGHYDYIQSRLDSVSEQISNDIQEFGDELGIEVSLIKLKALVDLTAKMIKEADYCISGDTSSDDFNSAMSQIKMGCEDTPWIKYSPKTVFTV